jgi:hypothetical protein
MLALWETRRARRARKPRVGVRRGRAFDRDPLVAAIARQRADWRCEIPQCQVRLFVGRDGARFVEVHHIRSLASGGDDTPENVACLCPLHHREAHFGRAAADIATALYAVRAADGRQPCTVQRAIPPMSAGPRPVTADPGQTPADRAQANP